MRTSMEATDFARSATGHMFHRWEETEVGEGEEDEWQEEEGEENSRLLVPLSHLCRDSRLSIIFYGFMRRFTAVSRQIADDTRQTKTVCFSFSFFSFFFFQYRVQSWLDPKSKVTFVTLSGCPLTWTLVPLWGKQTSLKCLFSFSFLFFVKNLKTISNSVLCSRTFALGEKKDHYSMQRRRCRGVCVHLENPTNTCHKLSWKIPEHTKMTRCHCSAA